MNTEHWRSNTDREIRKCHSSNTNATEAKLHTDKAAPDCPVCGVARGKYFCVSGNTCRDILCAWVGSARRFVFDMCSSWQHCVAASSVIPTVQACECELLARKQRQVLQVLWAVGTQKAPSYAGTVGCWFANSAKFCRCCGLLALKQCRILQVVWAIGSQTTPSSAGAVGCWYSNSAKFCRCCRLLARKQRQVLQVLWTVGTQTVPSSAGAVGFWHSHSAKCCRCCGHRQLPGTRLRRFRSHNWKIRC
jgi:hypothetical protein